VKIQNIESGHRQIILLKCSVLVLAFTYILTAISKTFYFDQFSMLLYPIFNSIVVARIIAVFTITLELTIAFLLLVHSYMRMAAIASVVTLLFYSSCASVLKAKGLLYECGCFGALIPSVINLSFYIRNLGLIMLSLIIIYVCVKYERQLASVVSGRTLMASSVPFLVIVAVMLVGWAVSNTFIQ